MPYNVPRFPLDVTGTNVNNLIIDEPHTLSNRPVRAVSPNYGPFFTQGLIVKDGSNVLVRGQDYQITELHQEATLRYGKEIASVILIINPNVSTNITITYQVLGGHYAYDDTTIANVYSAVINDNRPVSWLNVINKPTEFNPTIHRHLLEDIYGFEPVVDILERIKRAITLGQAEVLLTVLNDILLNKFIYIRDKFDKNLNKPIRADDLLYYLTNKKIISKVSCNLLTSNDIITKGRSIKFEIDSEGYGSGRLLYYSFITHSDEILNLFLNYKGSIVTNNNKQYLTFYVPTDLNIDLNKDIYLVLREYEEQKDYVAISYRARLEEAVTTSDYICYLMTDFYNECSLVNLINENELDEALLFYNLN